ncbi:hypothetical protein HHL28_04825 [Aerophototrophica crusticola]|uniref:Uncharacterized protein n=1 Tax=Aerophototrophica crusticola TaxID=1709002 RepID=A0A858R516_9PROT|nr:hypothetical protein HHL28_04825 [Rhodospirillaceae bacterium B3]
MTSTAETAPAAPATLKDRAITALIWVGMLGAAWSLPVLDHVQAQKERALMESGHYYTPKMPAEYYLKQGE